MPAMHDKPTDETRSAPDNSAQPKDGVRVAELPDRVAELSAADPADAPRIADEIAAVLEESLDSAVGPSADGERRDPDSATGDR